MKRVVSLGGNEIVANITVKTDTIAYWDDDKWEQALQASGLK